MVNRMAVGALIAVLWPILVANPGVADTVSEPRRSFGLGDVWRIAVSPDERFLATAGQGGAFLWNVQTGELLQRLATDWAGTSLTFSTDGDVLVTSSANTLHAWDTETGALLRNYHGHSGEISDIEFARGGRTFVTASADNTARLWSLDSDEQLHIVRTPASPIQAVVFMPDARRAVTLDTFLTNSVKLWDMEEEMQTGALPMTNRVPHGILLAPGGNLLTWEGLGIALWDLNSLQMVREYKGITGNTVIIRDVWTPDDMTVAAACSDGNVYRWNLGTAELLGVTGGDPVIVARGFPTGPRLAVANLDYEIRVREVPSGDLVRSFTGHTTSTHTAVAFSPNGRYVLSGGTEAATRLWDRETTRLIRTFVGADAGTMAAAFSPDGSRVLTTTGLPNSAAQLWNVETGEVEREFRWPASWPMGAVFSPDGTRIATRSQDQRIRIFDVATGSVFRVLTNAAWARAVAFSSTAPLLACASPEYAADLYNYESGQLLHTFVANAGPVTSTVFSPNGDTLLIAWQDGLVRLYNTFTMELRREFFTRAGFLNECAYSPDGKYLLTGEGWPFFSATIWNAETLQPLRIFAGHKWSVDAVAFSSDGESILTGSDIVREWSISGVTTDLRIEQVAGEVQISWSKGQLQRSEAVNGAWQTMLDATSPFRAPVSSDKEFYRVLVEPGSPAAR